MMGKSNAERQRAYRDRHLKAESGEAARLNLLVPYRTKIQLARLAHCYGVTKRQMLEQILAEAERALIGSLSGEQQDAYYDQTLTLQRNNTTAPDVTP